MLLRFLIPMMICASCAVTAQTTSCLNIFFSQNGSLKGDTLEVTVSTKGFVNIIALEYTTEWDPQVLQLIDAVQLNRVFFSNNIESPASGVDTQGSSRFVWNDPFTDDLGETLPEGTRLYTLRFLVKNKSVARTKIGFSPEKPAEFVYNTSGSSESIKAENIPVGLSANLVLKGNSPSSTLKLEQLCTSSADCKLGNIIPTISGGVTPYVFFTRISNGTLARLRLTNLVPGKYPLIIVDAKNDTLEALVSLTAPAAGIGPSLQSLVFCSPSRPDSAVIRINAFGGVGQYAFDWSDDTYEISRNSSQIAVASNRLYSVTVTDSKGCEAILNNLSAQECIGNSSAVSLVISGASVVSGEVFCSKVDITNVQDLSAVQFAIRWNPEKLSYLTLKYGDDQINNSNFNLIDTQLGLIRFAKNYTPGINVTRKTLFELCFQAKLSEDTAYLAFDNQALPVEIATGVESIEKFSTYTGEISISPAIWPGDSDRSGHVDHFDLLPIGLALGNRGLVRNEATLDWRPQRTELWGKSILNASLDLAFIDADGNGLIASSDTLAIQQNWQRKYQAGKPPLVLPEIRQDPIPLFVRKDTIKTRAVQSLSVELGTADIPGSSVYGVAFSIVYNPAEVDEHKIGFVPTASWLGTKGEQFLSIQRNDPSSGRVDVALVRGDQQDVSGFGRIGNLLLSLEPSEAQRLQRGVNLEIRDVKLINKAGQTIATNAPQTVLPLSKTVGINEMDPTLSARIQLYPQPADQRLQLDLGGLQLREWTLMRLNGESIARGTSLDHPIQLEQLPAGMYLMRIRCDEGIAMKKCLVMH